MAEEGLRNLFLWTVLAPELDLRSGSVGANFFFSVTGAELALAEHCQHLAGDSRHLAHTSGWTRNFHG